MSLWRDEERSRAQILLQFFRCLVAHCRPFKSSSASLQGLKEGVALIQRTANEPVKCHGHSCKLLNFSHCTWSLQLLHYKD